MTTAALLTQKNYLSNRKLKSNKPMTSFIIQPMFAANAAVYAIQNATVEGKITAAVLLLLSLFSWTIIITKFRQLHYRAQGDEKIFRGLQFHARPAGHPAQGRGV